MRRLLLSLGLLVLVLTPAAAPGADVSLNEALAERSMGSADAPVVMHEYASLTCSHCAAFHADTLPEIKQAYIDTGKLRLVYHDFPFGNLGMAAAMVARCSGKDNYFPVIGALFSSQKSWTHSETPFDALVGIVRLVGMSEDDVDKCLDNQELLAEMQKRIKQAADTLGINSTPTFFVDGKKIPGNLPFEDFQDIFDKALAAKQTAK